MKSERHFRKTRIVINGREYRDASEVPEEFRHLLRDADGNGIPDIVERSDGRTHIVKKTIDNETTYNVNGVEYSSLDEMPADIRELVNTVARLNLGEHGEKITRGRSGSGPQVEHETAEDYLATLRQPAASRFTRRPQPEGGASAGSGFGALSPAAKFFLTVLALALAAAFLLAMLVAVRAI